MTSETYHKQAGDLDLIHRHGRVGVDPINDKARQEGPEQVSSQRYICKAVVRFRRTSLLVLVDKDLAGDQSQDP